MLTRTPIYWRSHSPAIGCDEIRASVLGARWFPETRIHKPFARLIVSQQQGRNEGLKQSSKTRCRHPVAHPRAASGNLTSQC